MFVGVRRRLALLYAAIFAATLLLLGPVLYLSLAHQLAEASDAALRLAAQREAARAFTVSVTATVPPRRLYLIALANRMGSTCSSRAASPNAHVLLMGFPWTRRS